MTQPYTSSSAILDAEWRRGDIGTTDGLRASLARIALEGWDGPTGTEVLRYARDAVVRPQVRRAGLRAAAADQAESTGWGVAWEVLRRRLLLRVESPWGVVTVAVRRAVRGESVAAAFGTDARRAWRLVAAPAPGSGRPVPALPVVSLTALQERGWEPPPAAAPDGLGKGLEAIAAALVGAGWDRGEAVAVLEWVAGRSAYRCSSGAPGWRTLAAVAGIPPWRARRATVLLLGAPGWPGLVAAVARNGRQALDEPGAVAAIRSTVRSSHLSPATAARRAGAYTGGICSAAHGADGARGYLRPIDPEKTLCHRRIT